MGKTFPRALQRTKHLASHPMLVPMILASLFIDDYEARVHEIQETIIAREKRPANILTKTTKQMTLLKDENAGQDSDGHNKTAEQLKRIYGNLLRKRTEQLIKQKDRQYRLFHTRPRRTQCGCPTFGSLHNSTDCTEM
jgi:hypothetical protein